jgi:hypothetical protein
MSLTDKVVIDGFHNLLDLCQKVKIEARLNYVKGRFNYLNNNFNEGFFNLFHAFLYHDKFSFKLKAFISLFMLIIKMPKFYINKYLS